MKKKFDLARGVILAGFAVGINIPTTALAEGSFANAVLQKAAVEVLFKAGGAGVSYLFPEPDSPKAATEDDVREAISDELNHYRITKVKTAFDALSDIIGSWVPSAITVEQLNRAEERSLEVRREILSEFENNKKISYGNFGQLLKDLRLISAIRIGITRQLQLIDCPIPTKCSVEKQKIIRDRQVKIERIAASSLNEYIRAINEQFDDKINERKCLYWRHSNPMGRAAYSKQKIRTRKSDDIIGWMGSNGIGVKFNYKKKYCAEKVHASILDSTQRSRFEIADFKPKGYRTTMPKKYGKKYYFNLPLYSQINKGNPKAFWLYGPYSTKSEAAIDRFIGVIGKYREAWDMPVIDVKQTFLQWHRIAFRSRHNDHTELSLENEKFYDAFVHLNHDEIFHVAGPRATFHIWTPH
jgi:hypothetical protein